MTETKSSGESVRPVVRPKWRGRYWIPIVAALLFAYASSYLSHRKLLPNNGILVQFGPRDSSLVELAFAPAVWIEKSVRKELLGDAQQLAESAVNRANAEHKHVMLIFTDNQCPGCVRLKAFLQEHETIVSKHLEITPIHTSFAEKDLLERRYRDVTDTIPDYIPFIVITDGDGSPLANSGIKLTEPLALPPGDQQDRAKFLDLLRTTASPMDPEDEATLRRALR